METKGDLLSLRLQWKTISLRWCEKLSNDSSTWLLRTIIQVPLCLGVVVSFRISSKNLIDMLENDYYQIDILETYNRAKTNEYSYWIRIVSWNYIIVHELLVFD